MTDQDTTSPSPPFGPFLTNWGPLESPILARDEPPALGIIAPDALMPIGIAFPAGLAGHRKGPAASFRLVVHVVELTGRWLCGGRRFVTPGGATEPP